MNLSFAAPEIRLSPVLCDDSINNLPPQNSDFLSVDQSVEEFTRGWTPDLQNCADWLPQGRKMRPFETFSIILLLPASTVSSLYADPGFSIADHLPPLDSDLLPIGSHNEVQNSWMDQMMVFKPTYEISQGLEIWVLETAAIFQIIQF